MSVFSKFRELVAGEPDRTREEVCTLLQSYGVGVRLAERRRWEEKIGGKRGRWILHPFSLTWVSRGDSIGIVIVDAEPILWINVLKYQFEDSPTDYWYLYGIPDYRLYPGSPSVHLKSALIRKSWLGEVIGVKWKGEDYGLGIIERLSKLSITNVILDSHWQGINADLEINAEPKHSCWLMWTKTIPTQELWDCYQSIAGELLEIPLPEGIEVIK